MSAKYTYIIYYMCIYIYKHNFDASKTSGVSFVYVHLLTPNTATTTKVCANVIILPIIINNKNLNNNKNKSTKTRAQQGKSHHHQISSYISSFICDSNRHFPPKNGGLAAGDGLQLIQDITGNTCAVLTFQRLVDESSHKWHFGGFRCWLRLGGFLIARWKRKFRSRITNGNFGGGGGGVVGGSKCLIVVYIVCFFFGGGG